MGARCGAGAAGGEVVFAEQPHGPYDYSVPPALAAKLRAGPARAGAAGQGQPAGRRLLHGGRRSSPPASGRSSPLAASIDAEPLLSPAMLRLAQWMSDYYLCPLGQVLQAIVPAGVRGKAGTREMTFLSVPPAVRSSSRRAR